MHITINLTNTAPAAGLLALRHHPARRRAADLPSPVTTSRCSTTTPPRARTLQSVTLNGKPSTATVEHAFGHPIFRAEVELPRGTTQTLELHLQEARGSAPPRFWRQPGVTPLNLDIEDQPC